MSVKLNDQKELSKKEDALPFCAKGRIKRQFFLTIVANLSMLKRQRVCN